MGLLVCLSLLCGVCFVWFLVFLCGFLCCVFWSTGGHAAGGGWLGEGLALKVGDIDADRMRVQVRDAKGNRDRFVPLAPATLSVLRRFWQTHFTRLVPKGFRRARTYGFLHPNKKGLIALLHSDIDIPYAKPGGAPTYLARTTELLRRHPKMNLVWAHTGLGRIVQPRPQGKAGKSSPRHVDVIEGVLTDSTLNHVYFDISWDEVAKYVISAPDVLQRTAALLNRFPDRFLFGTDNVAPKDAESYFSVYEMYQPLWKALTPEASQKIRIDNYERLFDAARKRVRAWERDYL